MSLTMQRTHSQNFSRPLSLKTSKLPIRIASSSKTPPPTPPPKSPHHANLRLLPAWAEQSKSPIKQSLSPTAMLPAIEEDDSMDQTPLIEDNTTLPIRISRKASPPRAHTDRNRKMSIYLASPSTSPEAAQASDDFQKALEAFDKFRSPIMSPTQSSPTGLTPASPLRNPLQSHLNASLFASPTTDTFKNTPMPSHPNQPCSGPISTHHRLRECRHLIRTPHPTACGPNCSSVPPSLRPGHFPSYVDARSFSCQPCLDELLNAKFAAKRETFEQEMQYVSAWMGYTSLAANSKRNLDNGVRNEVKGYISQMSEMHDMREKRLAVLENVWQRERMENMDALVNFSGSRRAEPVEEPEAAGSAVKARKGVKASRIPVTTRSNSMKRMAAVYEQTLREREKRTYELAERKYDALVAQRSGRKPRAKLQKVRKET
ncbi:hypothetical protein K402DRAFT_431305 [Aulographum hederae CBS 113979]|uniref:Uncharacterized protein n=1 Tax=Aulographum hederae CBS 113979 TaxID=1176131 RepID=A0A6G1H063_9PEZI|nr:hypothetical protein K402DRAFT_431305 [Aulographum hederae CBS 113979]